MAARRKTRHPVENSDTFTAPPPPDFLAEVMAQLAWFQWLAPDSSAGGLHGMSRAFP
jgi:hypothetical protein